MPDPTRHTFRKAERLCSKKRIEQLFSGERRSFSAYPLRAVYMVVDEAEAPVQLLISVSKRHFKHAVDRNRIKRLVREAYRLNKNLLTDGLQDRYVAMAMIWMSDERASYSVVEAKVKNLLQRIRESIDGNN